MGVHDTPFYDVAARRAPLTTAIPRLTDDLVEPSSFARSSAASSRRTTSTSRSRRARSSALIGPNGAGKTTFFNMLTGVYKPTAGRIVFDGVDVTGKPPHAITAARRSAARSRTSGSSSNDGARERAGRDALPPARRHRRLDPAHAAGAARGARRREQGARAARATAGLPRPRTTSWRGTCPTATSGGSRSRARSPPSRSCCCSTSRPPG